MDKDNLWTALNFGLSLWMAIGGILLFFVALSGTRIDLWYVYIASIFQLTLKLLLLYKTEELFSLQYLK